MSANYDIPAIPQYNPQIRKLQNSDPANAETVFNPLISQLIENTHAVKTALDAVGPRIVAFAVAGKVVTCTDGVSTMTETAGNNQRVTFLLPHYGVWKVQTAGDDGEDISVNIVADAAKSYTAHLSGARVSGVEWDYNNPSTALTRLTPATDPNCYVTEEITAEPTPAIGNGVGSSPFDYLFPWAGMSECNIILGTGGAAQIVMSGNAAFSRSEHDTMVYIPPFYFAVQDVPAMGRRRYYISDAPKEGFALHPGSGRYVGRYHTSGETPTASKTGALPTVNITRNDARVGAVQKGAGWFQYDFAAYCAIVMLYLVEFADWDSQTMIGSGIVGSAVSSVQNVGATDSMTYHTGRVAGENENACEIQYRHIEGLWSNVMDWVDGINFYDKRGYVCTTPANYADDTMDGYTDTGITAPSNNFIKRLGMSASAPWSIIPDESGGSSTTYIPDRVFSVTGWRVLRVGGYYSSTATSCGVLYFICYNDSSYSSSAYGARLLYVP